LISAVSPGGAEHQIGIEPEQAVAPAHFATLHRFEQEIAAFRHDQLARGADRGLAVGDQLAPDQRRLSGRQRARAAALFSGRAPELGAGRDRIVVMVLLVTDKLGVERTQRGFVAGHAHGVADGDAKLLGHLAAHVDAELLAGLGQERIAGGMTPGVTALSETT
jgi:hypothetical protein